MIAFDVYGIPAPQGSKRHVGGGRMIESSKKVKPWREAVKWAAVEARKGGSPMTGPLIVTLTFSLTKPKSAPKTRATYPDRKPDIDKLARATLDGLTDGGVWIDDAQVISLTAHKCYSGEGLGSLDTPGCRVTVYAMLPSDGR